MEEEVYCSEEAETIPVCIAWFMQKSLSLNRKQFLEHFFDYERKQFFKDRLKALLLSITRNKIRKERMIYIVYFHRFVRNSMLTNIPKLKLERLS